MTGTGRQALAAVLEIPERDLNRILGWGSSRYPYTEFDIPKKSGAPRRIQAPHPTVKILQSKLNHVLREIYDPPRGVHGYVRGRSIVSNAIRHSQKQWVLNVDLQDFFPSINFGRVQGLFLKRYGMDWAVATAAAKLCTHGNALPQGAPTSPIISNMICEQLDRQLHDLARANDCWFTRYADDITFSSRSSEFPSQLAYFAVPPRDEDEDENAQDSKPVLQLGDDLRKVIDRNGFHPNPDKMWLKGPHQRRRVTGIVVNEGLNVDRRYVRRIRAILHELQRDPATAQARFEEADRKRKYPRAEVPRLLDVVRGMVEYVGMVKGHHDEVYVRLTNALGELDPRVPRVPSPPPRGRPLADDTF